MRSIIKQIYGGDLFLNERNAKFRTAREIAVQAQMIADEMVLHELFTTKIPPF